MTQSSGTTTETPQPDRPEHERPTVDCPDCRVEYDDEAQYQWPTEASPWCVVLCGPHYVDHLHQHGERVLPKRFRDADPAHLIPSLQGWQQWRSVYLSGPVGTGKTYQAAALVRAHYRL